MVLFLRTLSVRHVQKSKYGFVYQVWQYISETWEKESDTNIGTEDKPEKCVLNTTTSVQRALYNRQMSVNTYKRSAEKYMKQKLFKLILRQALEICGCSYHLRVTWVSFRLFLWSSEMIFFSIWINGLSSCQKEPEFATSCITNLNQFRRVFLCVFRHLK